MCIPLILIGTCNTIMYLLSKSNINNNNSINISEIIYE